MKEGKKPKFTLGVAEAKLGNAIQEQIGFPCACNEQTGELLRGVRAHAGHLTKARITKAHVLPDANDSFTGLYMSSSASDSDLTAGP